MAISRERVLSGIRPSGRAHIGNYLGAIQNYVALQDSYECFYSIVDIHTLTTMEATGDLHGNIWEMALDLLAAGIDPNRATLFIQSHVPEVMVLHTLLSMITPFGRLIELPTFKETAKNQPHNVNYGLVGYPVLMTADIILYKATAVPVGEDQLPHLELARDIVRRFNRLFGQTFPEPQPKLTNAPLIYGLDGTYGERKMSKSLNNHVELAATPEETQRKVLSAVTDPARRYRGDPGHPELCNVYHLHEHFTPERLPEIFQRCTTADIGCVDCKSILAESVNRFLAPFRERRRELSEQTSYVKEVLVEGDRRARAVAKTTIEEVRERMGLA